MEGDRRRQKERLSGSRKEGRIRLGIISTQPFQGASRVAPNHFLQYCVLEVTQDGLSPRGFLSSSVDVLYIHPVIIVAQYMTTPDVDYG
jgi:hypothetical protein